MDWYFYQIRGELFFDQLGKFTIIVTYYFYQLSENEMTEDFKHAMIDSIVISAEDKYGHHLNKNYDWMDDFMI